MNKLTTILIVIILALLVYLALKPDKSSGYLDAIEQKNEEIVKQLDQLQETIEAKFDSLDLIKEKETIIREHYNEIIQELDNVNTFGGANSRIRLQLDSLGTARFD
jgi:hypothetical protein